MTMMICSIPEATASSTAYWMIGRSTSGIISLGIALVAGRKRVPNPAAGRTALRTRTVMRGLLAAWSGARPVGSRSEGARRSRSRSSLGDASIPRARRCRARRTAVDGTIAPPMLKSLVRTFRGPSRDPRMTYISRPLPRDLPDEQVVEALELALAADPNPATLVETLPAALAQVTGRDLQVLDRSVRDVTGAFSKVQVMIRDGDVGLWPGYDGDGLPAACPLRQGRGDARGDRGRRCHDRPGRARRPQAGLGAARASGAAADGPSERPARPVARSRARVPALRRAHHRVATCTPGARCRTSPKLLLLYCPNCGDRVEINHI